MITWEQVEQELGFSIADRAMFDPMSMPIEIAGKETDPVFAMLCMYGTDTECVCFLTFVRRDGDYTIAKRQDLTKIFEEFSIGPFGG